MSDWGPELLDAMFVLHRRAARRRRACERSSTRRNTERLTTAAFWLILGFIFAFGESTDTTVIGVLVMVLGALTLARASKMGTVVEGTRGGEGGGRGPARQLAVRARPLPGGDRRR